MNVSCSAYLASVGQLKVYGTKRLDVQGGTAVNGASVAISDCTGTAEKQWRVHADGSVQSALNTEDIAGGGKCPPAMLPLSDECR